MLNCCSLICRKFLGVIALLMLAICLAPAADGQVEVVASGETEISHHRDQYAGGCG